MTFFLVKIIYLKTFIGLSWKGIESHDYHRMDIEDHEGEQVCLWTLNAYQFKHKECSNVLFKEYVCRDHYYHHRRRYQYQYKYKYHYYYSSITNYHQLPISSKINIMIKLTNSNIIIKIIHTLLLSFFPAT